MYRAALLAVLCFVVLENNYCLNVFMLLYRVPKKIKKIFKLSATLPKGLRTETKLMYSILVSTEQP